MKPRPSRPKLKMVACVACGRVVRARPNGKPGRHRPSTRLRGAEGGPKSIPEDELWCDGSNYEGDVP